MKKYITALIIGLFTSISCMALEITTHSPYKDTAFKFEHSYALEFSSENAVGEFEDEGEFTITRNLNKRTLTETINALEISVMFKNKIIDKQAFNAAKGGTNGEKQYSKDFNFDGKKGHIEYTLNVEFNEDKEYGKIVKLIDAKISKILIDNVDVSKKEL